MEYEKCVCPVLNVDGVMATGKQYDIDITLPEDNRSVIYGVIKDCYQDPIADAVVKLIEISCECGEEERKPVSHTFTDKEGEFVFGPLCANRLYEIQIWVDKVKHCKVCTSCKHEGKCLKGVKLDCPPCLEKHCDKHCDKDCDKHCDKEWDKDCDKHCDKDCDKHCDKHQCKPCK